MQERLVAFDITGKEAKDEFDLWVFAHFVLSKFINLNAIKIFSIKSETSLNDNIDRLSF